MPLESYSVSGNRFASGTAFMIAPGIAITASHNIPSLFDQVGVHHDLHNEYRSNHRITQGRILAIQRVNEKEFLEWGVTHVHKCRFSSDIAILRLTLTHEHPIDLQIHRAVLDLMPPELGTEIRAFGYTNTKIDSHLTEDHVFNFQMDPIESVGVVNEVFDKPRDAGMYNFPCITVNCNFPHGMSGGPVIKKGGGICGLVSGGWGDQEGVAALLWPCMAETIIWSDFNNGKPFIFFDLFWRKFDGELQPRGKIQNFDCVRLGMDVNQNVVEVVLHENEKIRVRLALDDEGS
jgi:Trypsin-like peptidase domain